MIKIGVLGFMKKEQLDFTISKIKEHTKNEYELLIACDSDMIYEHCIEKGYPCVGGGERLGYARNRNRIHKWFIDNPVEHLFKFDDDCYPIQYGWDEWVLNAHKETGYPYFVMAAECGMYGKITTIEPFKNYKVVTRELDGTMMCSMQPVILEKIGGVNVNFGKYGGESSEFGHRVKRAGMIPWRGFSLKDMDKWLWSPHIDEYIKLGPRGALTEWDTKQAEADYAMSVFPEIASTSPIYQEPII